MANIIASKNCLNCNEPLKAVRGKRDKVFCNSTCRSNYWQRADKLEKEGKNTEQVIAYLSKNFASKRKSKEKGLPLPKDYVEIKGKISGVDKTGKIVIPDIVKPTIELQSYTPEMQGALNEANKILQPEQSKTPKTLDELKALCPKELTGLDRSTWISQKRQEYGI